MSPFTKSLEQGAATSVYCACATELKDFGGCSEQLHPVTLAPLLQVKYSTTHTGSGSYFMDCYIRESTPLSHNQELQQRLIELSDAAIEKAMRPK
jgi:hypothetical protein